MSTSAVEYRQLYDDETWLCLNSTWAMGDIVLGLDFDEAVHGDIFRVIDDDTAWDEGIIMLPRGTFKSHLVAAYIVRRICGNRNFRGLILGATHTKVAETVYLTRQFLEMPAVTDRFGSFKSPDLWNKESFIVSGRTRAMREPTLYAMGMESFKAGGHHDLVVGDDLEDQDTVNTAELMAKTRRNESLSYPMADEINSKKLTVGTFWDDGDVYSHKIRTLGLEDRITDEDGREHRVRPRFKRSVVSIEMPDGSFATKRVFLACKPATNPDGTALFPKRHPLPKLALLKRTMSASLYSAQYELDPIASEDAKFKPEQFRYANELPPGKYEYWIGLDFARSFRKDSDHTGRVVVAINPAYRWWVLDAWRKKIDGKQIEDQIVFDHQAFPEATFSIEEDAYAAGLRRTIEERLLRERIAPRIEWIKSGSRDNKNARINATAGLFVAGAVTFLPGTSDLEEELLRHPVGKNKDVKDAWANVFEKAQSAAPEDDSPPADERDDDPAAPWNAEDDDDPYKNTPAEDVPWKAA